MAAEKRAVSLKHGGGRREERHRHKTMLKVMDPNVHQIMPVRRHNPGYSDDSDGVEYDTSRQNHRPVIIKHGISPKIAMAKLEMKKHIARQSDLINSLEKSDIRNSREVFSLKQKIREQERLIEELRKRGDAIPPELFEKADLSESELEDEVRRVRKEGKRGHHDKWHNQDYEHHYKHLIPEGPKQRHQHKNSDGSGLLMLEHSTSSIQIFDDK